MAIPARESSRFILPAPARERQVFYDNNFLVQTFLEEEDP